MEFDEDTHTLDDRLLCLRVGLENSRKIRINACINGEWGREGSVKHKVCKKLLKKNFWINTGLSIKYDLRKTNKFLAIFFILNRRNLNNQKHNSKC